MSPWTSPTTMTSSKPPSPREACSVASLREALEHLEKSPGKRLRPQLVEAAALACGGGPWESAAEAVELIHTYSLVHDDLPAMDDDSLRRGQPTLHVAFDEATAILVGDGLQARAFELIATDERLSPAQRVELITCLSRAAGFNGMVGGQAIDIASSEQAMDLHALSHMHALKTGALITAALELGAIVAEAHHGQRETLRAVGERVGLAFQIIDDVIDVITSSDNLGKTSGKDAAAGKTTYVYLMGLESADAEAGRLLSGALEDLDTWGEPANELRAMLKRLVVRDR